jgi:hypothetical protein
MDSALADHDAAHPGGRPPDRGEHSWSGGAFSANWRKSLTRANKAKAPGNAGGFSDSRGLSRSVPCGDRAAAELDIEADVGDAEAVKISYLFSGLDPLA